MCSLWKAARRLLGLLIVVIVLPALLATPTAAQNQPARFELRVEITWSAETAPYEFPNDAHLSPLIGVTHNSRYVLFRDGYTATAGLELVAENGRTSVLKAELAEAMRRGRVGAVVDGPKLDDVPGVMVVEFEATPEHPALSFVTMIAPSPDWFTGAVDVALISEGEWIEELEVPLWAWDCGTDGGDTYAARNDDVQPRQSVRLLSGPHFLTPDGLVAVGKARIRRVQF